MRCVHKDCVSLLLRRPESEYESRRRKTGIRVKGSFPSLEGKR